jgi:hypothetical protein
VIDNKNVAIQIVFKKIRREWMSTLTGRVSAAMTTTPIHRLPMTWKRVKAPELPGSEQHEHGKILHPRIRIAPRN